MEALELTVMFNSISFKLLIPFVKAYKLIIFTTLINKSSKHGGVKSATFSQLQNKKSQVKKRNHATVTKHWQHNGDPA